MPGMLDVRQIENELRDTLARSGPAGATLELVNYVPQWKRDHGLTESNKLRQAVAFPGINRVVMQAAVFRRNLENGLLLGRGAAVARAPASIAMRHLRRRGISFYSSMSS